MQASAIHSQPQPRRPLVRAIRYLGKQRRTAMIAYAALLIATLAQLAIPQLTENMLNAVTEGYRAQQVLALPPQAQAEAAGQIGASLDDMRDDRDNGESILITATLAIVAFAIMRGTFSFTQSYMAEKTSQGVAFDFRNEIYAKIQRLSFSYHDKHQTGQLMIRATDDVEKLRLFIAQGLVLAVQSFLLLITTLVILFLTNWRLTLVILPTLPIAMVLFLIFGAVTQPLFIGIQQRLSKMNTVIQETLAGMKVVKAFAREPYQEHRFEQAADDLFRQSLKVSRTFAMLFPMIFLISQLGQAAILYFGGRQLINGDLQIGEYQEFSLYLLYVFFPMGQLGFIVSLMAQANASAKRVFEILDTQSDVQDAPDAKELSTIQGNVEFRDVTFRYFQSSAPVLDKVSFSASSGQTVALLGATGSGKTTIINLIPRFYDPTEGAILIDGQDIRTVTIDSLRSQIGIVLQETNLFSGTIRDNIAFGRSDATLEEVIAAAKSAAAHEFIAGFPQGYDTPVGERGTTLSGGQKQRIAIARALLLNPRLLILDDSTSSVDLITEKKIQKALDYLMEGRTSFVIAQRISTVLNADLILVLDKGQVVASGTHAELMETSELYTDIYHSQLVADADAEETPNGTVAEKEAL